MARSPRQLAALKWSGLSLGALFLLLALLALVLDWNADAFRGPIGRIVSAHVGRPIHLNGRLQLKLLSLEPRAIAESITVGNPEWAKSSQMARLGRLEISLKLPALLKAEIVVPRVSVQDLDLVLERDASDRANWRFAASNNQPEPTKPANLPVVRSFSLNRARVEVSDAIRKLHFKGNLAANQTDGSNAQSMRLDGNGEINGAAFGLAVTGDSLLDAERGRPYNFITDIHAGATRLQFQAHIDKPFDLGLLTAKFSASGPDLADVYYLTGLTLPNTRAYTLAGELRRDGNVIQLPELAGTLGNSDIHGTAKIDISATRPVMKAELVSRSLDIDDLGPALGGTARSGGPAPRSANLSNKQQLKAPAMLLPDAPLDVARVRAMDADVHYRAAAVTAQKIPFKEVNAHIQLDHGVMTIDPLSFVMPEGRVAARLRVDARRDIPNVAIDGRLSAVQLSQFHGRNSEPPLDGVLVGRLAVRGQGRSVHAVAATANGTLTTVVPHGQIRAAFAELTGINIARGLGLLFAKDQQKAELRCAVADFKSTDGLMTAQNIVVDTQNVMITGKGTINLRTEALDISVNGQPKKVRLASIKSPVVVRGSLRKPAVALDTGHVVKQGAIAGALAAIAPLAAVLAFVDPGLAKDADCGALLSEAQQAGVPVSSTMAPRTSNTHD